VKKIILKKKQVRKNKTKDSKPIPKEKSNKRPVSPSKSSHYIDKEELFNEIVSSQTNNQVSDKLAEMFGKIIDGVSHRFSNLQYYDILDDVKQDCYLLLIQKYKNFNIEKNTSCFAYFTTVVYNQIRYQLSRSKRYRDNKENMINAVVEFVEAHKQHFLDDKEDN
jgi:DNA-directed RNA polymerase specialized sigma24 family protein